MNEALARARALLAAGDVAGARLLAERCCVQDASSAEAWCLLAMADVLQGRAAPAIEHAELAVRLAPDAALNHLVLGRARKLGHDLTGAVAAYERAIALDPQGAEAHVSLGIALKHLGDLDRALACHEQAVALAPGMAAARANLAYTRAARAERQAAEGAPLMPAGELIEDAARAAALEPANPTLQFNLGLLLRHAGRRPEAIEAFNRALGLVPHEVGYCLRLGHELLAAGDTANAVRLFERWLELNPPAPAVMRALANQLARDGQASAATAWAERAARLDPDPKGWLQLCHALQQSRRLPEALDAGRRAVALSAGHWEMYSLPLMVASYLLEEPGPILALHEAFGRALARALPPAPPLPPRTQRRPGRLRVGYVSCDFISHSVAFFMGPLLTHHDRSRFEVWCYHGRGWSDATTESLKALGHHWVECEPLSDEALFTRIRDDGIDILVDLTGHTAGARLRVFGMGAAPLQLGYLGYPTVSGVRRMQHRLTDASIDPGDMPALPSDQPLVLPGSMFCYRPPEEPPIAPEPPSARGTVTFGSFNNLAKLSDRSLALWARVLHAVPGSRLLLKAAAAADPGNRANIESFMAARGITADRLDLRSQVAGRGSHLAVYDEVDVALDPTPYNGATTTCEALWMGVPVVSLRGRTHAGRMGASLLGAAGRLQWLADDDDRYVAIAAQLAADLAGRTAWRAIARHTLRASRLMDERGFTRDVEALLERAWSSVV